MTLPSSQNITRVVLDNGITILVYENFAAQSVILSGSLQVGSAYESEAQNGIASLVSSAVMRGTKTRDFNAIHEALEDVGADMTIAGGWYRTNIGGKALAEDLPILLDVLADVVRQPTFPEPLVDRLRGEVITSLRIRSQDTRFRAGRAFYETLYPPGHPYHSPVRGTEDSVSQLATADLAAFHAANYGAKGMILVVVGAVNAADAVELVRARFGDWHNPNQPPPAPAADTPVIAEARRSVVTLPGKTQADLVIGAVGPARRASDFTAAQLANSVLGQFGMMGRVGKSVREEGGMAYYAYSQLDGGVAPLPWNVSAGVNPQNIDAALSKITDEIRRLTEEPISADDLADNQAYFTGHLPLQLETNEGIGDTLHNMELHGRGLDYLVNYRDMIYSITRDDILAAARRYLDADKLVVGIAKP